MDTIGVLGIIADVLLELGDILGTWALRGIRLWDLYGPSGIILNSFGSQAVWRIQAEIIGGMDDEAAMSFKKSAQDECTMISVAAAIVAQIAISAMSLDGLDEIHWVALGLLNLCLVFALTAVFYSTTQHLTLGRLVKASEVRGWIRGGTERGRTRLVPSLEQLTKGKRDQLEAETPNMGFQQVSPPMRDRNTESISHQSGRGIVVVDREQNRESRNGGPPHDNHGNDGPPRFGHKVFNDVLFVMNTFYGSSLGIHGGEIYPCEPRNFSIKDLQEADILRMLRRTCFTPSVASAIRLSAQQGLLSGSLASLLVGLGIYLGLTWKKTIEGDSTSLDSQNIFIMYIVGLGVCVVVYSFSGIFQNRDSRTEKKILEDYMKSYILANEDVVSGWGVVCEELDGGIRLNLATNTSEV